MNGVEQKPPRHLGAFFRSSSFVAIAVIMGLSLGAALFAGPLMPWRDVPDHLALISLLDHARVAGSVAAQHYELQGWPVPYWIFYGSVWLLACVLSWTAALQTVAFAALILTPLALGRLMHVLGRDPRWCLLSMPLFFNHNLMYGWLSYCLGIPIYFMALAALIEALDDVGARKRLGLWSCLLFLAHAQLAVSFALITFYLVLRPNPSTIIERIKRVALPLSAPVLLGLPWVIQRLLGTHNRGEVTQGAALIFHDPVTRLKRLPDFLTNCWNGSSDDWMGLATLGAVVLLSRLKTHTQNRGTEVNHRMASGLVLITAALYFFAPWEVRWPTNQWAIYNRFAMLALIMTPLLIRAPFPEFEARRRALPAAILLLLWAVPVLVFARENFRVYDDFNQRNAFVLEAVSQLEPNRRILPLVQDAGDPASHLGAADQFHAYYVIRHGGYDPYLFDNPSHPVVHRKATKPTVPPWNQPSRDAARRALKSWAEDPLGKDKPFTYVIEQRRGGPARTLGSNFKDPVRIGSWIIHQRNAP